MGRIPPTMIGPGQYAYGGILRSVHMRELGLEPSAALTADSVREAFAKVVKASHPDTGGLADPARIRRAKEAKTYLLANLDGKEPQCVMCGGTGHLGLQRCMQCNGTGKSR